MAVFYSFHFERDYWRVQQVMQFGAVEGQPLLNSQDWEKVKRQGETAIKNWIEKHMKYKQAVVVLVGSQTASRPWVEYEIAKAWNERRPLVGVRIHGLEDASGRTDSSGANPFSKVTLKGGGNVGQHVALHTPSGANSRARYADIKKNLPTWVSNAYKRS
jgi:hypothetical protein